MNTTTPLVILDSGTFNVYAPNAVAEAYANQFSPAGVLNETLGGYVVPCDAIVPSLSVTIGGVKFPFDEKDLIFPLDANGTQCLSTVTNGGNSTSDVYILWVTADSLADFSGATSSSTLSWQLSTLKPIRSPFMSGPRIRKQYSDRGVSCKGKNSRKKAADYTI
jgi:hypothetical protein